jgi:hypothetical protein
VKRSTLGWCAALLLFLAATNRYADPVRDHHLYFTGMGDALNYHTIGLAAPNLPSAAMPFHHAQRLAIPYGIGLIHEIVPVPIHWLFLATVVVITLALTLLVASALEDLSLAPAPLVIVLATFVLNPWVFRAHLAYPEMVNDLSFILGLAMLLRGLFRQTVWLVVAGQLVMSASRQTGLLVVPMVILWLWIDRRGWGRLSARHRIGVGAAAAVVAILTYLVTSDVAERFAEQSRNVEHFLAGITWARTEFDARELVKFLLMAAQSPFVTVCLLVFFVARASADSRPLLAVLAIGFLSVSTQPLLGGPVLTSGSVHRLVTIGMLPLLLAAAIAIRQSGAFTGPNAVAQRRWIVGLLVLGSLHQALVNTSFPIVGQHTIHRVLYSAAVLAAAAIIVMEARRLRRAIPAPLG